MDALLDTSILVELLRNRTAALAWAANNSSQKLGVPVLVKMELVQGVQNQREFTLLDNLLADHEIVFLQPSDCAWAAEQHSHFRLSHDIGILDTLIASSAMRLKVPIYTLNVRHFSILPDVQAIQPY